MQPTNVHGAGALPAGHASRGQTTEALVISSRLQLTRKSLGGRNGNRASKMMLAWPPTATYRTAGLTFLAAALVALYFIRQCLKDGSVLTRSGLVERAERPVVYWIFIGMYVLLAGGFLVIGAKLLIRPE
jgi:hypothetical protein